MTERDDPADGGPSLVPIALVAPTEGRPAGASRRPERSCAWALGPAWRRLRRASGSPGTGEPELHSHAPQPLDRTVHGRAGLATSPCGLVKHRQTEVAPRLERPHTEGLGQRQGLLVALAGGIARGGRPSRGHLGLCAQRPRFVPALATVTGLLECSIGPHGRVIRPA